MSTPLILRPPIIHPVPYTLLIFDADGTLRGCTVPGRPPNTYEEAMILPNVEAVLQRYAWKRTHFFGIASNQGGIGLGYIEEDVCGEMLYKLGHDASWYVWPKKVIQYCPHAPRADCLCRKPHQKMLQAIEMYWYSHGVIHGPDDTLFIGDQDSDRDAAARAGMAFCWAQDFFGWPSEGSPMEGAP